jgi:hypothetical protein
VPGSTTGPHIDDVIEQDAPKRNAKTFFGSPVDPRPPERIRISGQHGLFTKFEYLILNQSRINRCVAGIFIFVEV